MGAAIWSLTRCITKLLSNSNIVMKVVIMGVDILGYDMRVENLGSNVTVEDYS